MEKHRKTELHNWTPWICLWGEVFYAVSINTSRLSLKWKPCVFEAKYSNIVLHGSFTDTHGIAGSFHRVSLLDHQLGSLQMDFRTEGPLFFVFVFTWFIM